MNNRLIGINKEEHIKTGENHIESVEKKTVNGWGNKWRKYSDKRVLLWRNIRNFIYNSRNMKK